jgi:hypothetical protein
MHQFVLPFLAAIAAQSPGSLINVQPDVKPSMDMMKCVLDTVMPQAQSDQDAHALVDTGMEECSSYRATILQAATRYVTQERPEPATPEQMEAARKLAGDLEESVRRTTYNALIYLRAHPETAVK